MTKAKCLFPAFLYALATVLSLLPAACGGGGGESSGDEENTIIITSDAGTAEDAGRDTPEADSGARDTACDPDNPCDDPGARRCDGGDILECTTDRDGCASWETVATCDDNQTCSDGSCVGSCSDECSPSGATECSGTGERTCEDHDGDSCLEWGPIEYCGAGERCNGGSCQPTSPPHDGLVISEILYDADETDEEPFVEIHGPADTDITGYTLVGVDGGDGDQYGELVLQGATDSEGLFLIAPPGASSDLTSKAQQVASGVDYQNGPDSLVLRWGGTEIDAVGYGNFSGATFAGEGTPHPGAESGESLARYDNDIDSDDNLADFYASSSPTPGEPNDRTDPCRDADGICPASCTDANDTDCAATCGNGVVEAAEECDDGNNTDGDGCSRDCKIEHGLTNWSLNYGGGTEADYPEDLAVDSQGNVFVAGEFSDAIDFNGATRQTNDEDDIDGDGYLAKFDDQGNFQWAETFGGKYNSDRATGVAVDSQDNVYVTGTYRGQMTLGSTSFSSEPQEMVLAKFDNTGNYQWSQTFTGAVPEDLTIDGSDHLYATGDTFDHFAGSSGTTELDDLFVAKFDASGQTVWSTTPKSSTDEEIGLGLDVDASGNVYVTGGHEGEFTMPSNNVRLPHEDPDPDSFTERDVFVLKLDASGEAQWGHAVGADADDTGTEIAVDPTGGAVLTGFYHGDPGTFVGEQLDPQGSEPGILLASFDTTGSTEWVQTFGAVDEHDKGQGVAVDQSGNVYMGAYFDDTTDFGNGPVQNAGANDIIVASYDSSGNYRWSKHHGTNDYENVSDLFFRDNGQLLVTGKFNGSIDFGDGRLDASSGNRRIYLLSMTP